ncbi:MAG TPA: hypothetical protein VL137_03830 [Polyangiaceae bacterium]|nr:hypothetical protein [Polyangiaceae bacterium]
MAMRGQTGAVSLLVRAFVGALFVVSCHGILGLEDKREVQNYGTSGYTGCRNGSCDQCLRPSDKCQCEGKNPDCSSKSALGDLQPVGDAGYNAQVCSSPHGPCASCICNSCEDKIAACLDDPACGAIFACIGQYVCNPFPRVPNSCYAPEYCEQTIDVAGGLSGVPYAEFLAITNCGLAAHCSCDVDAPTADASSSCSTTSGSCVDRCLCGGGAPDSCAVQCSGGGTEAGSPMPLHDGGGVGVCQAPDCNGCSTQARDCLCRGGTADDCLAGLLGDQCTHYFSGDDCNSCACNSCPSELLDCFDDSGCVNIAQCMRITGCTGGGCDNPATCGPVIAAHGGRTSSAFLHAAALQRCRTDNTCPCTMMGDTSVISCDTHQCSPYTDPAAASSALSACCFQQAGQQFCGLSVSSSLYSTCEPRNQTGRLSTDCPGFQTANRFPYKGAFLDGCCRPTTGTVAMNGGTGACGYNDNVTGLGCLPPHIVDGVTTTAGNCTYTP